MFANCQVITGATLHYMFVLCIQNCLLCLRLPSYNRHVSCATKSFIEKSAGLEMSVGCLASASHFPCMPCVQCFSGLGSHLSPSFSSRLSPFCGICGGGRSPVCCSAVMAERQKGHSSPGNWWWQPCHPFWGWPWRSPCSHYHPHHCWACCLRLRGASWRQAQTHLLVVV